MPLPKDPPWDATNWVSSGVPTAPVPGQTLAFPDTPVGQTKVATVQVINTGNASAPIASKIPCWSTVQIADAVGRVNGRASGRNRKASSGGYR